MISFNSVNQKKRAFKPSSPGRKQEIQTNMSEAIKGRKASARPVEATETNTDNTEVETEIAPVKATSKTAPKAHKEAPMPEPEMIAPEAADVFPDFAASPEEVTRRTEMLRDYVKNHMTVGEDYGVIPGGNKPTLFKPGAEKLNAVFGLSPMVEVSNRVEDWDNGFVAYEMKVTLLNKRTGGVEAEGIGSCNSRERRYKNQDAAGIANTVLKMAKKRALVDATLSATRASGMFTQDLEDIEFESDKGNYSPRNNRGDEREAPRGNNRNVQRDDDAFDDGGAVAAPSGGNPMTEPQHRAIMAIAGKVFGRHSRDTDLDRMIGKPIDQLSKHEASDLIGQLKEMQEEADNAPQDGDRETGFVRAGGRER